MQRQFYEEWLGIANDLMLRYIRAYKKIEHLVRSVTGKDPRRYVLFDDYFYKRIIKIKFNLIELGGDAEDIVIYVSLAKSPLRPYRTPRVIKKLRVFSEDREGLRFTGRLYRYKVYVGKATRGSVKILRDFGILVFSSVERFKDFLGRHYLKRLSKIMDKVRLKVSKPFGVFAVFVYFLQLLAERFGQGNIQVFSSIAEVIEVVR